MVCGGLIFSIIANTYLIKYLALSPVPRYLSEYLSVGQRYGCVISLRTREAYRGKAYHGTRESLALH